MTQKLIEILLFTAGCFHKFQIFLFTKKQQNKAQVMQGDNQVFDLKTNSHIYGVDKLKKNYFF